ncbi:aroma-sacti cluster domain-containing protein [Krasilnikovia sp. MM14-A1259]|uniref:aroma-sacti cluster domain-containing protein n=1 Tax=Krasilnikovia sp. MM14-A1259 TaxID=3373539 RepID=UPI003825A0DE
MHDSLAALRAAGLPVEHLSDAQRDVLAALTEHETAVLVAVQHRLNEVEPEVVAHNLKLL